MNLDSDEFKGYTDILIKEIYNPKSREFTGLRNILAETFLIITLVVTLLIHSEMFHPYVGQNFNSKLRIEEMILEPLGGASSIHDLVSPAEVLPWVAHSFLPNILRGNLEEDAIVDVLETPDWWIPYFHGTLSASLSSPTPPLSISGFYESRESSTFVQIEKSYFGSNYFNDELLIMGSLMVRQVSSVLAPNCPNSESFVAVAESILCSINLVEISSISSTNKLIPSGAPVHIRDAYLYKDGIHYQKYGVTLASMQTRIPLDAGFIVYLPTHLSTASKIVQELHEWHWMDESTRIITINLSILNRKDNILYVIALSFEFPIEGGVNHRMDVTPIGLANGYLTRFSDTFNSVQGVTFFIWIVSLFTFFLLTRISHVYKKGLYGYFSTTVWNSVDIVIPIFFFLHVKGLFRVRYLFEIETNLQPENFIDIQSAHFPFSILVESVEESRRFLCIVICIAFFRLLKLMRLSYNTGVFANITSFIRHEYCAISVGILILCAGMTICVHTLSGKGITGFSTMTRTFALLVNGILNPNSNSIVGISLAQLVTKQFSSGFFVFISYAGLIICVYSFILAVSIFCYRRFLSTGGFDTSHKNPRNRNPVIVFIFTVYNNLRGIELYTELSVDNPEAHNDLEINTELLPTRVQRQWTRVSNILSREISQGNNSDDSPPSSTRAPNDTLFKSPRRERRAITRLQLGRLLKCDQKMREIFDGNDARTVIREFKDTTTAHSLEKNPNPLNESIASLDFRSNILREFRNIGNINDIIHDVGTLMDYFSEITSGAIDQIEEDWKSEIIKNTRTLRCIANSIKSTADGLGNVETTLR